MDCRLTFYTYIHASPDGDVFYVGKGKDNRAYSMSDRSWVWRDRFNKNDGILVKIVRRFETELESYSHEKELIEHYKSTGCDLVNMTEGGPGVYGYVQSEKTRQIKRQRMLGYKHELVTCPNCGTSGGATTMKRWHFDRCNGPSRRFPARVTVNGMRIYLGKYETKAIADQVEADYYAKVA
jgi:hypothetical protein